MMDITSILNLITQFITHIMRPIIPRINSFFNKNMEEYNEIIFKIKNKEDEKIKLNNNIINIKNDIEKFKKIETIIKNKYDKISKIIDNQNQATNIEDFLESGSKNDLEYKYQSIHLENHIELCLLEIFIAIYKKDINSKILLDILKKPYNEHDFPSHFSIEQNASYIISSHNNETFKNAFINLYARQNSEAFLKKILKAFDNNKSLNYKKLQTDLNEIFDFQKTPLIKREKQLKEEELKLNDMELILVKLNDEKIEFENRFLYIICKKFKIHQRRINNAN